jgi:hypothetical protein
MRLCFTVDDLPTSKHVRLAFAHPAAKDLHGALLRTCEVGKASNGVFAAKGIPVPDTCMDSNRKGLSTLSASAFRHGMSDAIMGCKCRKPSVMSRFITRRLFLEIFSDYFQQRRPQQSTT